MIRTATEIKQGSYERVNEWQKSFFIPLVTRLTERLQQNKEGRIMKEYNLEEIGCDRCEELVKIIKTLLAKLDRYEEKKAISDTCLGCKHELVGLTLEPCCDCDARRNLYTKG